VGLDDRRGYTKVGSDHMNKMLRSALDRAFLSEEQ
jgi:hypothetical protein